MYRDSFSVLSSFKTKKASSDTSTSSRKSEYNLKEIQRVARVLDLHSCSEDILIIPLSRLSALVALCATNHKAVESVAVYKRVNHGPRTPGPERVGESEIRVGIQFYEEKDRSFESPKFRQCDTVKPWHPTSARAPRKSSSSH